LQSVAVTCTEQQQRQELPQQLEEFAERFTEKLISSGKVSDVFKQEFDFSKQSCSSPEWF
jgi:hypothetical protein